MGKNYNRLKNTMGNGWFVCREYCNVVDSDFKVWANDNSIKIRENAYSIIKNNNEFKTQLLNEIINATGNVRYNSVNDGIFSKDQIIDMAKQIINTLGLKNEDKNTIGNNNITELVFILDASGSMDEYVCDTIGGFNSMLQKQKNLLASDKVLVTTVLFNTTNTILHDRKEIKSVKDITEQEYMACGRTALYDAIGETIKDISNIHKYSRKEDIPRKTLFIINTDGLENASRNYTQSQVKSLIEEKKQCGWEFIFLGANIDVVDVANGIGINKDRCAEYVQNGEGIEAQQDCIDLIVADLRKYDNIDHHLSLNKLNEKTFKMKKRKGETK